MEIWKTIPDYEDYQVSNLGNVKSLKWGKEKILKGALGSYGYYEVNLLKDKKQKIFKVHKLVAMGFLGHKPDGTHKIVVDHINNIKTDNRVENLQLITNRENCCKDKRGGSSSFAGVSWHKKSSKWRAAFFYNKTYIDLGLFEQEAQARDAYNLALSQSEQGLDLISLYPKRRNRASSVVGVSFQSRDGRWKAKKKGVVIGYFNTEIQAINALYN
jgi:hypothetical protein